MKCMVLNVRVCKISARRDAGKWSLRNENRIEFSPRSQNSEYLDMITRARLDEYEKKYNSKICSEQNSFRKL